MPGKIFFSLLLVAFTANFAVPLNADVPRTMYVINESAETISGMNMNDFSITPNLVQTGQFPNQIAAHNDLLYVVNSGTDDITVIDPVNNHQITKMIALPEGSNPWAIGFVGADKAYVPNWIANTVAVIDLAAGTVVKEIEVGQAPEGILVYGDNAFVANTGYAGYGLPYDQSTVSIINTLTDSITQTLDVPTNPQDFAVDPMGRIHVVCTGNYVTKSGKIAVIDMYTGDFYDTPAIVKVLDFGWIKSGSNPFSPGDLAITTDGIGYCVSWGDGVNGFLCSYDALKDSMLHSAVDPILVGPNVSQLLFDPRENVLWIPTMTAWGGDGFVQKFDVKTNSVVWVSNVLGNGTKSLAILEPIYVSDAGADAVAEFKPGAGAGLGQAYFPDNILGPPDPDPAVSAYNPSTKPQEILSLGHGGEIVLEFTDNYIYDGDGVDFTVFENVFISLWTGEPFIEAGIVSVSKDGITFVEFPYDTSTWAGLAGVTPVNDNSHPTDPAVSGGDQFDLADVGMDFVRFVKITDLGDIKQEGDWNGDFDLDAVVAVNSKKGSPAAVDDISGANNPAEFELAQNYPNPFNPETSITFSIDYKRHIQIDVYNTMGQLVKTLVNHVASRGVHRISWDGRNDKGTAVSSGIYICRLRSGNHIFTRKMMLTR
ncbi:T9SS type A sorting domain-containing protein [candidate division KSB1 bacterium]|nr:T9SS type A sorting domain-containing protein [candidate division KSB1 bacterium]